MVKHPFFQNSKCINSYLHRFSIAEQYEDGVLEVCEICKKTRFFKVIMGKLNNYDYMNWHFRNALPKNHPYYEHEHSYNQLNDIVSPYYE